MYRSIPLQRATGVCSYVQKHVIDALEGFSQFLANEVSKVRNIVFVIVFIFGFINCNVVLLDANTANFGSTSLALTASIFTLSTYIGIVIVNSVLCRKILNVYITFLLLSENWDSIAGNDPRNENYPKVGRRLSCAYRRFRNKLYSGMCWCYRYRSFQVPVYDWKHFFSL